jgi:hypothetical protein
MILRDAFFGSDLHSDPDPVGECGDSFLRPYGRLSAVSCPLDPQVLKSEEIPKVKNLTGEKD